MGNLFLSKLLDPIDSVFPTLACKAVIDPASESEGQFPAPLMAPVPEQCGSGSPELQLPRSPMAIRTTSLSKC